MTETQTKILDTAERLFGEQGYAATSLRHIIAEAGVNLAAIHYHFGSKEELLDQLVMRRAGPVNEERLALLDRFEAEAGGAPVPVEKLLRAFLEPPILRIAARPDLAKFMGRMYGEGLMPVIAEKHFQHIVTRFLAALGRALPRLTPPELELRVQFMLGAMAHTLCFALAQSTISGTATPADGAQLLRELIAFLSGGLRTPAVGQELTEEK
jgi:AcrR family transcriptional regulator